MNAKEARYIASNITTITQNEQQQEIQNQIKTEADSGAFSTVWSGYMFNPVKLQLKRQGFVVNYHSARNESWYEIKW